MDEHFNAISDARFRELKAEMRHVIEGMIAAAPARGLCKDCMANLIAGVASDIMDEHND